MQVMIWTQGLDNGFFKVAKHNYHVKQSGGWLLWQLRTWLHGENECPNRGVWLLNEGKGVQIVGRWVS